MNFEVFTPHPASPPPRRVFDLKGGGVFSQCFVLLMAVSAVTASGEPDRPVLPIAPVHIVHTQGGQARDWFAEQLKIGLPFTVVEGLEHLTTEVDFVFVDGVVAQEHVKTLMDYVESGGTALLAAKFPSNETIAALLPYDPSAVQIKSTPEKWGLLTPVEQERALFSGLPWDSDAYDHPVPPVMKYVDIGALAKGASVLATWNRDGPPALVVHQIGRGRVIVWTTAHSLMLEPDIKRRLSAFIDYFVIKLYCWLAGHEQDAVRIGRMAAARMQRNQIGLHYATCRAMLQDASAAAQFLDDEEIDRGLAQIDAALVRIDQRIDRLDSALLNLDFSTDPKAGYQAVVAEIEQLSLKVLALREQLDHRAKARDDVVVYHPRKGYPLRTGIFLTMMDQQENTINGEYKLKHYLRRVKEAGFDVTMLYVTSRRYGEGGYGIGERSDGFLWKWKPGRAGDQIEYRFDQQPLGWFMDLLERHGHKFIVQLSYSKPPSWVDERWQAYLKRCVEHFESRDVVLAFEPNNEGIYHKRSTDADFRTYLLDRYGDIGAINGALGTSFESIDRITKPKMISLGGKKQGPEAAMKTPFGSPQRALYYEFMRFEMDWIEAAYKQTYLTIKGATSKPVNSRDSPIPERLHGGPRRMERRAKWHDSIGTHLQEPFDIERSRGFSGGRPLWLTEYYWWQWGGDWAGHRYRLHGSLMLPIADIERKNLAAKTRNFWQAVARRAELFAYYMAYPYLGKGQWERGYGGIASVVWPDYSIRRPIFAARTQRKVYERFGGEIQGSHTESRVALMEPTASRLQMDGSMIKDTTGTIRHETRKIWSHLRAAYIQSDPIPPTTELSSYRYVFLPSGLCLADETVDKLIAFVELGGTLIATLAPGEYDGYTRPAGRILDQMGVKARLRRVDKYAVELSDKRFNLRSAAVYSYQPQAAFDGRIIARYADGEPAWIEGGFGSGRIHLIGWAAHLSLPLLSEHVIPTAINRTAIADWKIEADGPLDAFVRHKENSRLFFITNTMYDRSARATLVFDSARDMVDLRSGFLAKRREVEMPRLAPGACRVFKVFD